MIREIKRIIKSELDEFAHTSYRVADADNIYPHIIFDLPNARHKEGQSVYTLDIDIWDDGLSTSRIDIMSENIREKINKQIYAGDDVIFASYHTSTSSPETKTSLKRILLIFELNARRK